VKQFVSQNPGELARLLLQSGVQNDSPLAQETRGVDFAAKRVPGEQLAAMGP
jgi:hypothetical protein